MSRAARTLVRTLRREAWRLAALAIAIVLFVGVLRGGARYLYCPVMDEVVSEHCCAEAQRDAEPGIEAPDCCESHGIAALPASDAFAAGPRVADAPLLAVLPPPAIARAPSAAPRDVRDALARAAGPPVPDGRAARLVVLLI